ncbi:MULTISPECIES: S-layer homology domain-containing protein [unclassified Lysinibacillus]|uniref:S-layer homology domain-containing protein n=1 Tax=unclassified Lysinibacillus TaxID=2636778 RepID=UPI0020136B42|nr:MULTISPECIES: S-layer homology domain-containing protein [unclassified Lysinibacillus]MCL1696428.1 S-layer homology domain-containing protein [Lysinibacillus sp. BPa_S21]MCL1700386.1 S-layer homology domain-containing protein [Lysinibacillus sp. Bpr_S20]
MKGKIAKGVLVGLFGIALVIPMQVHAYQKPTDYVHMQTPNMTVYSAYGATINASEKGDTFSVKANIVNNRQPLEVEIFKNGQNGVLKQVVKKGEMEPVAYRDLKDRVIATIHNNAELTFVYSQPNNFRDLGNSPYSSYITSLSKRGIVQGKTADHFGVNDSLTRAQVSALLTRAFSFQQIPTKQFKDINVKKSWYSGYVGALHSLGIINGKTSTTFDPNGKITRQQAILMLGRTLEAIDYVQEKEYVVLPYQDGYYLQGEALQHTKTLYAIGALNDSPHLLPNQFISRGEFAKLLAVTLSAAGRL